MKNKSVYLSAALRLLAVAAMTISLALTGGRSEQGEFTPPPFEAEAQSGMPDTTDSSWTKVYQNGMNFSAHICGRVVPKDESAELYFTNDDGNKVWLKLRILDEKGTILAETGLLKPNEYVKTVPFYTTPGEGTKISLKIMAYEPDTYYSAGAVTLNTTIGG